MDDAHRQLMDFFNELSRLRDTGKEEDISALIEERFAKLPEDMQGELLARLSLQALDEKVAAEDAQAAVWERGLEALVRLDSVEEDIGKGGTDT